MVSQRAAAPTPDSRTRLLDAATAEVAAHGFDGTTVDQIAARARLNKAMLYYHFHDKAALYRAILLDVFRSVAAAVADVDEAADADTRLRVFIRTIATQALGRPHFPAMWLREIADGGRHLNTDIAAEIGRILQTLGRILEQGVREGRFRAAHPLIVQMNIVAPLLMFSATAAARARMARAAAEPLVVDPDDFLAHVETAALAALRPPTFTEPSSPRSRRRRS